METKLGITKLNNRNFQMWKFKIEMLLSKEDLWETMINDIPDPITADWSKKNRQAMATISLLVEDDQLIHIRNHKTAIGMWNALKDLYERPNLNSKLYLLRKIYKARLKHDQTMDSHINEILETVELLRGLGEHLKDNHVAAILLCSLPESYGALITALETRSEDELTLDYVKSKLIDEYRRRKENGAEHDEHKNLALKTKGPFTRPRQDAKECYYCKKTGHIRRDCRLLKRQTNSNYSSQNAKLSAEIQQAQPTTKHDQNDEEENEEICFFSNEKQSDTDWFIDSGATSHMTNSKEFFTKLKLFNDPKQVKMADGRQIKIEGVGSGRLFNQSNNKRIKHINLSEVLYIPELESNLISVKRLTKLGYTVTFSGNTCMIDKNDIHLAIENNEPLYILNYTHKALIAQEQLEGCIHDWHRRLGHRDLRAINKLKTDDLTSDLKIKPCNHEIICNHCIQGKNTIKPFPKRSETRTSGPFQLIHSDLCGPMRTPTIGGKRYAITFTDDYSRYSETYLIKDKHETTQTTINYLKKWTNYFRHKPHTIRTDGGGEYINSILNEYLKNEGIQRQITVPYSPQQNGVSERKNRHLLEMTRCMLSDAKLDNEFWGEAISTASYLQNRLYHSLHGRTPHELWHGKKPRISHIRRFGCEAHVHLPNEKLSKLDMRTKPGRLMGFSQESKGYRINLNQTNKVIIARNVTFTEHEEPTHTEILPCNNKETEQEIDLKIPITEKTEEKTTPTETKAPTRQSTRVNKGIPAKRFAFLTTTPRQEEPNSINDIMKMNHENKENWIRAINEEMESFKTNDAWELVNLPAERTAIGNKWTFKIKYDEHGNVAKYKARLVAKGFTQRKNIDYTDTYAPVVKYQTLRMLLTIASQQKMLTRHLDVKSAFLNGILNEEIYMTQPEGTSEPHKQGKVCRLKKAIYGLKQSACAWNEKINETLTGNGYTRGEADKCLYAKHEDDSTTYVLLYVDDLLICSTSEEQIHQLTNTMQNSYQMKDLGPVSYYLGIHIKNNEGVYALNQTSKIEALLNDYFMELARDTHIPMETDFLRNRDPNDKLLDNNEKYTSIVGSLLHLAMVTRPDISAAVAFLGRRVSNPTNSDWKAALRVLKYLKTTKNHYLVLGGDKYPVISAYVDADWAGDNLDRKSTSGIAIFLADSLVGWISKKQTCTALSTAEAEYVAASAASQELLWSRQLLKDFLLEQNQPIILHEDNQSCIKIIESNKTNSRSKHIDVRFHMIRDLQEKGIIKLVYCSTDQMIADIFTKPLPRDRYQYLRGLLGISASCVEEEC